MLSRDEILSEIRAVLGRLFEIDPDIVVQNARLYDDLDIDSIDAVDLIDQIRRLTGKRIDPDDFHSVETVGDIVDIVERILAE
jgi:acyl carrier protein